MAALAGVSGYPLPENAPLNDVIIFDRENLQWINLSESRQRFFGSPPARLHLGFVSVGSLLFLFGGLGLSGTAPHSPRVLFSYASILV